MKLNLMCGDDYRDGYTNIDLRDDCRTDLRIDATDLPLDDNSVDEVIVRDGLEHFPASRTDAVLAEWGRVLRPGGTLTVKVPNMLRLSRAIVAYDERDAQGAVAALIRNVYGGRRWGPDGIWDAHGTGWTPSLLFDVLDKAGFDVFENDYELNMTVSAVKR